MASRRAELVSTAQERARQRELERQQVAEKMRELQFRESCDAVRTKQSQQRHRGIVLDQKAQVRHSQEDED